MLKKTLPLLLLTLLLLAGCGEEKESQADDGNVFCAEDAQVCPDGSAVSRVPPTCEFAPCFSNLNSFMPENKIKLADLPQKDCSSKSNEQTKCPKNGEVVAKITTNYGEIWLKLFPDYTPKTVENFIGLSERGYYDNLIFHRTIQDFMIQGGDPSGNGTGGESIWGKKFKDEFTPKLKNLRGALSMANAGPNTNGSQFFIVQKDGGTPWLDNHHTVFGQVFSGMDVVDEIANVTVGANDKPMKDVKMEKVETYEVES